uniref:Peptidase aspartic and Ubiquitin-associated translation elongation factor EF1B domain containing protein n=1 Tax=Haemonchus contortus TaxID=6289 RepID=W6NBR8_HAECO
MFVSLTNLVAETGYDVPGDMTLNDLLALCSAELFGTEVPPSKMATLKDGKLLANPSQTLEALGVQAGDVLLVRMLSAAPQTSQTSAPHQSQPSSSPSASIANNPRITELIKSIKVPPSKKPNLLRENARKIYQLMENPAQRAHIYFKAKPLVDQYTKDPKDFEAFVRVYEHMIQQEIEKARLMADPASVEGQRLIQEQIQLENINYSYAQALEHTPEAYIPVHMLYIKMEINGHPVKAFVDSGAQVSIMSEACAQRCQLSHLIDKRFTGTARGVGGTQKFVGKIHCCQVKVMDHYFPCNFDVMADREMDLLLGLNILKRHQCNINLKTNMLEMGDGTMTPFLSDSEINSHLDDLASSNPSDFAVDADMLAQAMNLGFSEAEAKEALQMTRNDLEAALQQLFSKADERSHAMEH